MPGLFRTLVAPPNWLVPPGLNQVEAESRWNVEAADEPATMTMPTGLKAPKAAALVSVTRIPVEPADEPMVRQSAAVSEALQAAALWVTNDRFASRSISEPPEPVNLVPVAMTSLSMRPSEAVWPALEPKISVPELFQVSRPASVVTAGVVTVA